MIRRTFPAAILLLIATAVVVQPLRPAAACSSPEAPATKRSQGR